jgi:prepilin-type N-terminal cleavage/methylation domain-containing protein
MNRLRHKKRSAFTLVELLIVITIIGILIAILLPVLTGAMDTAARLACSANLSAIGKAMSSYSTKYQQHLPTVYQYAKPPTSGAGSNIKDHTGDQAWADDLAGYATGKITATTELPDWTDAIHGAGQPASQLTGPFTCNISCLFLMVRTGDAADEKIFQCKADTTKEDDTTQNAKSYWSFHFISNCSYSYQNQLPDVGGTGLNGGSRNTSQSSLDPRMVIAADMNPSRYYDEAHPPSELSNYDVQQGVCTWNSPNHKYQGQNCLYGDFHVEFKTTPFCGYDNSNIWTRGVYTAATGGTGSTSSGSWSNADPKSGATSSGSPPAWTTAYGGTPVSGTGAGTGDKFNNWLVP